MSVYECSCVDFFAVDIYTVDMAVFSCDFADQGFSFGFHGAGSFVVAMPRVYTSTQALCVVFSPHKQGLRIWACVFCYCAEQ